MSMGGCIHFLKIVAVFYATITSTRTVSANNKVNSIFIKKVTTHYSILSYIDGGRDNYSEHRKYIY